MSRLRTLNPEVLRASIKTRKHELTCLLELASVCGFGVWFTQEFITRPKSWFPSGADYSVSILGRFFWDDVGACGTCALWNGNFNGGNPGYLDPGSDLFHPITAITSLIWGTLYGGRMAIPILFALGGVASWWLAYVLKTGTVARVTAGILGITGGYLTGRMEHGLVVFVVSLVTASFLFPALICLYRNPSRRNTALAGLILGLTALSGQAYVQVAVAFMSPVALFLFLDRRQTVRLRIWRSIQLGAIALLVAAVQVLPTLRWWDIIGKDRDPYFVRAQEFKFTPVNLVVSDETFYRTQILDKEIYPGLYVNYIGWLALIAAVIGLVFLARRSWQVAAFLSISSVAALWLSSATLFRWMASFDGNPSIWNFATGIRTPSNMANLAVPPIIGLAAVGLDSLLVCARNWYRLRFVVRFQQHRHSIPIDFRIALVALAILAVRDVTINGRYWLRLEDMNEFAEPRVTQALVTDELRWFSEPLLSAKYQLLSPGYQIKDGAIVRPWWLLPMAKPAMGAVISGEVQPGMTASTIDDVSFWTPDTGNPYAQVYTATGETVTCRATGRGANISVVCPDGASGILMVQERMFNGWQATTDQGALPLSPSSVWLSTVLPEGVSTITFRFKPTEFWVGALLSLIGLLWVAWWIIVPNRLATLPSSLRRASHQPEPVPEQS